jgi:two-component system chemotaxis sensor kinase CheA
MDDNLSEVIGDFVAESREHLADIESELLAIEESGASVDLDLVNRVFRAIHSVKGTSGFLGLTVIGVLSHALENVLDLIRKEKLVPNSAIVEVLLRAADTLRSMIEDVHHSNDVDVSDHLVRLEAVAAGVDLTALPAPASASAQTAPSRGIVEPVATATPHAPEPSPARSASDRKHEPQRGETSIRVPVGVLDRLMNLAGELVLSRNQLLQAIGSQNTAGVEKVGGRVNQVTTELQEAIMQTRMQPVANVFAKFPRVVRDLAQKLGKKCDLTIEGREVELDKSVIEAITDPLTHLVRNSIDHGIEMPKEREAAGKDATGKVVLRAFHQGGKVNIVIADDGRGIDPAKLRSKAVERGLITKEQASVIGDRDAVALIFMPGFSTATNVTDVSGRGVGMDVVRTNLEKIGGTVEVDSVVGRGTTMTIKIPLTLAILAAMVVQCGGTRYAIPQANIRELVRVRAAESKERIATMNGCETLRLRGGLLPIVRLQKVLDLEPRAESGAVLQPTSPTQTILVVDSGAFYYGIVVESELDAEEIVVKPLGRHFDDRPEFAGATILGDGTVALILDIAGIASTIQLRARDDEEIDRAAGTGVAADRRADGAERMTLVLFRNDPSETFALPMSLVRRIERVKATDLRTVGERIVYDCRGKALPVVRLEGCVRAKSPPEQSRWYVMVFKVRDREVGMLVAQILDIRDFDVVIDAETVAERGVLGSFQLDGEVTRLLDVPVLTGALAPSTSAAGHARTEQASPVSASPRSTRAHPARGGRLLLVEDSAFFRNQLQRFLEEEGFLVATAEDGQVAWERLDRGGAEFDVIVTDIEMPNLDGLGLTRRVKADARLRSIPVIAVTSLASPDDVERGREAGVDDYHVKLDKDSLLQAVRRFATAGAIA